MWWRAGIKAVLHCTPDSVPVHLYGFNWHNSTWHGHKARPSCSYRRAHSLVLRATATAGARACWTSSSCNAYDEHGSGISRVLGEQLGMP